jgi:ABC-type transport system substrate-binding protein
VHRWHIDENDVQVTWGNITFANVSDIRLIREGNLFRYLYRLNNDAWVQATSRTYVMDTVGYFDIWYYYDTVNYIAETATIDNFTVRGALSEFGTFRPAAKAMTFTGYAPTLSTLRENQVNVPVGNMTLALTTISITKDINPIGIDELVFTTYEPIPTGSATFTTYAPTVSSASLDYSEILGLLALNIEN